MMTNTKENFFVEKKKATANMTMQMEITTMASGKMMQLKDKAP